MNTKRYILAALAGFLFLFVFDFIFHAQLMHSLYMETQNVWRHEGEGLMWIMNLSQVLFALASSVFFVRYYQGKGVQEGVRYGLYMGVIFATSTFGTYMFLPVPFMLTAPWMLADILRNLGFGVVLALVYKK